MQRPQLFVLRRWGSNYLSSSNWRFGPFRNEMAILIDVLFKCQSYLLPSVLVSARSWKPGRGWQGLAVAKVRSGMAHGRWLERAKTRHPTTMTATCFRALLCQSFLTGKLDLEQRLQVKVRRLWRASIMFVWGSTLLQNPLSVSLRFKWIRTAGELLLFAYAL